MYMPSLSVEYNFLGTERVAWKTRWVISYPCQGTGYVRGAYSSHVSQVEYVRKLSRREKSRDSLVISKSRECDFRYYARTVPRNGWFLVSSRDCLIFHFLSRPSIPFDGKPAIYSPVFHAVFRAKVKVTSNRTWYLICTRCCIPLEQRKEWRLFEMKACYEFSGRRYRSEFSQMLVRWLRH